MTTNIGGASGHSIGFGETRDKQKSALEVSLRQRFTPELINRLDEIILFSPLRKETLEQIAAGQLTALSERLQSQGYDIAFDGDIAAWVADAPDTAAYGARPLRRFIHRNIELPLSMALLEGRLPQSTRMCRADVETLGHSELIAKG